jgi:hypothetical protein
MEMMKEKKVESENIWKIQKKIVGIKMVYEYTLIYFLLCLFSFCGSEIQVSRQNMLWGPQLYSCLSCFFFLAQRACVAYI